MESQFVFSQPDLKKKKKKLRHWEFHFDNSTKNDHIILLVSESSVPLSVLKTSCARVGALKLIFIAMKVNSILHCPFSLYGAKSGAKVRPRTPRLLQVGQNLAHLNLGICSSLFGACGALCCTVFVEQNAGGNDSFGIAVILGLYRSHRGHRKIKLLK